MVSLTLAPGCTSLPPANPPMRAISLAVAIPPLTLLGLSFTWHRNVVRCQQKVPDGRTAELVDGRHSISSVPLAHSSSGTTSARCLRRSARTQNTCRCTVACGLSGATVVRASYAARERCVADAPACRCLLLHHRYNIAFHQFQQRARITLWCVGGVTFCVQQHAQEPRLNVFFRHLFRSTVRWRGVHPSRETCPPTPGASVPSSTTAPTPRPLPSVSSTPTPLPPPPPPPPRSSRPGLRWPGAEGRGAEHRRDTRTDA